MGFKKDIIKIALQILKAKIYETDRNWTELKDINIASGQNSSILVTAFRNWASQNRFSNLSNPLAAFVAHLNGQHQAEILSAYEITPDGAHNLDDLCADLCVIGNESFTGRHRAALGDLLINATTQEIKDAYIEFISNCDDFAMKTAVKRFAEGGGKDFLTAIKRRKALIKEQEELVERTAKEIAARRAAEIADRPKVTDEIILPEA